MNIYLTVFTIICYIREKRKLQLGYHISVLFMSFILINFYCCFYNMDLSLIRWTLNIFFYFNISLSYKSFYSICLFVFFYLFFFFLFLSPFAFLTFSLLKHCWLLLCSHKNPSIMIDCLLLYFWDFPALKYYLHTFILLLSKKNGSPFLQESRPGLSALT